MGNNNHFDWREIKNSPCLKRIVKRTDVCRFLLLYLVIVTSYTVNQTCSPNDKITIAQLTIENGFYDESA